MVDCVYRANGCNGGLQTDAFDYYNDYAAILEEDYPYTGKGARRYANCKDEDIKNTGVKTVGDGWVQVEEGSVKGMKSALALGPLAVSVDAETDTFSYYESGIFDYKRCGHELDHAVLLVGYGSEKGKEYWIMKNSWAADWGEDGYMRLLQDGDGLGTCGIQMDCQYPLL